MNESHDQRKAAEPTEVPLRAEKREWIGLAVLALPCLLLALDATVLHLALPHLAADLNPSSTQQLWILDIYGFMIAGFLVTMGTLGDRIGRRRLLLIGAAAFGAASIAAAYSTSAEMLIVTRALLGIAGATLMPSTLSLIRNMFHDPGQRTMAIGIWMMCFSGGAVLGPVIGGVMLEFFWWGSVFLLGVPVMVLLLIAGPILLPEYRDSNAGRLDLSSAALSLITLLSIIYGFKDIAKSGWNVTPFVVIMIGVLVGWIFVRRQLKLKNPLIDIQMFKNRFFSGSLGILLLGTITIGGFILLFAQYLQMVKGLSPLQAGVWMVPLSAGSVIGALLAPLLTRYMSKANTIGIGLVLSAVSCFMITLIDINTGLLLPTISSLFLTIGMGPLMVLTTDLIIGSAPPEKSGSAASLSETSGELGIALGIAALGSAGAVVYRLQFAVPSNVPPKSAEVAGDNLAGALTETGRLSGNSASELLLSAQEAFLSGMNVVGGLSAVILLALAIFVGRLGAGVGARPRQKLHN
ncbi:MFS transporter [Alteribacillus sp. HJP-4]|uniref:MFS transporter n=1 Tax=Alteribacillus sp. HJP-4 TaxID=2775394 RepID=UPI0035CCE80F